ncbi:DUF416 family protein [Maribacter dokdonensis]|uniref:DUF416 family protein n=1 Tax=Maribacter dokdonensis TaxID=320912 RepID=UPI003D663740
MNWTEYREQLTKNVDRLSSHQKLKFAIEVCEKLFPDYKTFQEEYKWRNANLIADGLAPVSRTQMDLVLMKSPFEY